MIRKYLVVFGLFFLVGCHTKKAIVSVQKESEIIKRTPAPAISYSAQVNAYISNYKHVAMNNMKNYGIPASIILAQGILESGAGKGNLAITANNHFGIKCHKDWNGESVRQDDDAAQECFRKYNDPSESYRDHALFLTTRSRYTSLFNLPKDDYKSWATGLKAAGYATDIHYPEKLISSIERYELYRFDNEVLGKNGGIVYETEEKQAGNYEVQKGDTLYSISKKFNIDLETIKQKNNLIDNGLSIGQKLILE